MKNFFLKVWSILKEEKQLIWITISVLLIVFFAISLSPRTMQNDTYYTVTIGKLITENGIDMQDNFSWHELPYTYPHWLYDVGMYSIYNTWGWDGIFISTCIFTSLLGICIYFVNCRLSKNNILSFVVTIAVLYLLKGYIAARAQLVTFILFPLIIYNIERFLQNKKIINAIALVLIHTLIANLHVAVWPFTLVLYLPYIGEYLFSILSDFIFYKKFRIFYIKDKTRDIERKLSKDISKEKKEKLELKLKKLTLKLNEIESKNIKIKQKRDKYKPYKITITKNDNTKWLIVILIIAILTGFLTPLGTTPYTYTILTMKSNEMENINEHLPLTLIENTPILCTLIIVLTILIFTNSKIALADLFMLGGLCYLMFSSRRQSSVFVLIGSIPFIRITTNLIKQYIKDSIEDTNKKIINLFTIFVAIAIVLSLGIKFLKPKMNDKYIDKHSYPVEASEWILENLDLDKIKLYNEYNYGSYLLYKGIPVFIDSRADLYAPEFNSPTGEKGDGKDIFSDFLNCSNIGTYYGEIFEKYNITHIILYANSKVNMLIEKADSEKYKQIYKDDDFVIYEILKY